MATAQNGAVIFYRLVNQAAISDLKGNSLLDLVRFFQSHGEITASQDPVARFRGVFTKNEEIKSSH